MNSADNLSNNHPNYLKLLIKLSLTFFFVSVFVLGLAKFLLTNPELETETKAEMVTNQSELETEKTLEDLGESEIFKKVFNKEEASADTPPEEEEITQLDIPEATIVPTPSAFGGMLEDNESLENTEPKAIFDFNSETNYQAIISSFIARKKLANINTDELATIIITESLAVGINPIATASLIEQESNFNRYAEKANGRVGLMQIHPNEAKKITKKIDLPFLGAVSLYHPIYNIRLGLHLLQEMKIAKGSWEEAIKQFSKTSNPQKTEEYLNAVRQQIQSLTATP